MNKIIELFKKYRELIMYVIFGGLTTLINIVAFWLFDRIIPNGIFIFKVPIHTIIANSIAWFISVLFAFVTNKLYVFNSKDLSFKKVFTEAFLFFAGRIATGLLDTGLLWLVIDCLNPNADDLYKLIWKVVSNIIVIILNYIISKLVIFRKKKEET